MSENKTSPKYEGEYKCRVCGLGLHTEESEELHRELKHE